MALPEGVQQAAFRGVQFPAREIGFSGGRRLITHEYPQRDEPYTEDQGRATRRWRLQCFLCRVGDESWSDFQRRRSNLRAAFEQAGAGTLVHPADGELRVRVETIDETVSGLWQAEYQVSFVESGPAFVAETLAGSSTSAFAATLKTVTATAYTVRRGLRQLDDLTRKVLSGTIYDRASAVLGIVGKFSGTDVSEFVRLVSTIRDANTTLVNDAESFVESWQDVCDTLADEADGRELVGMLLGTEQDPGPFVLSQQARQTGGAVTQSGEDALEDTADTDAMLVQTALSATATLAAATEYSVYDDAIDARDALASQFATVIEYTTDPDTLAALQDTQAAVMARLTREAVDLPRLRTIEIIIPRPAVELAYALYGDPGRAVEIVSRNSIADPNVVSGAVRVLTE